MDDIYEVIDINTGKVVNCRSLYDSNGNFKPHDSGWSSEYTLRIKGTFDEVVIQPATHADELESAADDMAILADQMRQLADKVRDAL